MNPLIKVCSHPRSGTHFLEAGLFYNFYQDGRDLSSPSDYERGHWNNEFRQHDTVRKPWGKLSSSHPFYKKNYKPCVYITRNVRDVAFSIWKTKACLNPDWGDITFSEFIRKPLDWYKGHAYKAPPEYMNKYTIFEHWLKHITSWLEHGNDDGIIIVAYEDLKFNQVEVLNRISKYFKLTCKKIIPIKSLVGFAPNKGSVGASESHFTDEDEEFYRELIPMRYRGVIRA